MNSDSENQLVTEPKQKRSAETLERIVAAVHALLEEKDFREITIGEIARGAGVAPSLLYTRFAGKDDIETFFTVHILERYLDDLKAGWAKRTQDREPDIDTIITVFAEVSLAHRPALRSILVRQLSGGRAYTEGEEALIVQRLALLEGWINQVFGEDLALEHRRFIAITLILTIQDFALIERASTYLPFERFCAKLGEAFRALPNQEGS